MIKKRVLIVVLCLLLVISIVNAVEIEQGLEQELREKGTVDVIVILKDKPQFNAAYSEEDYLKVKKDKVKFNQDQVLSRLNNYGITKEEFVNAIEKIEKMI